MTKYLVNYYNSTDRLKSKNLKTMFLMLTLCWADDTLVSHPKTYINRLMTQRCVIHLKNLSKIRKMHIFPWG